MTKDKIYYHVRSHDGVTLAWLYFRAPALKIAAENRARVYEVRAETGKSYRIQ